MAVSPWGVLMVTDHMAHAYASAYIHTSVLSELMFACVLFACSAGCRLFGQAEYKELNKNNKVASRIQYSATF
jgi:hypothetical protein